MNSQRRTQLGFGLLALGVLFWVMSGPRLALATTSYQEHWQATAYRTALASNSQATNFTGAYCLGPSQWSVSGQVGDVNFEETWRVAKPDGSTTGVWLNSWPVDYSGQFPGYALAPRRTLAYSTANSCEDGENLDSAAADVRITTVGLYGGLSTIRDSDGLDDWNFEIDAVGVRSMPRYWHVEGSTR